MNRSKWLLGTSRGRQRQIVVILMVLLAACSATDFGSTASVFFVNPKDGATVRSPVKIRMSTENFTVERAGQVREGHGHLHIMIDTGCVRVGREIPVDDTHVHYGKRLRAELELARGTHRLCLQAADGVHRALKGDGMRQEITITVIG